MLKNLKKGAVALAFISCFSFSAQGKMIEDVKGNQIELPNHVERIADL